MSRSPYMHSNFFSSLNQVEKRLKTETTEEPPSVPQLQSPQGSTMTESLSNPIYLLSTDPQTKLPSKTGDSELPCEFMSASHKFSTTPDDCIQPQSPQNQPNMFDEPEESDDIQLLMQLLHLSPIKEEPRQNLDEKHCCCDTEFYTKIVGIKGPRCRHEEDRLESWITHLENGRDGETYDEPFRLAHLLLAKAAYLSGDENGGNGLEFPSTIQDFLINDPPSKCD